MRTLSGFQNFLIRLAVTATASLLFSFNALADAPGPRMINISGGLFLPNGSAVLNSNVTFKIEIRDKAGLCVLYSEIHTAQDLSQTKGAFSLLLGAGSSSQNFLSSTTSMDAAIFKNPGAVAAFTGCPSGLTLASGDERVIRVYYDTGSGLTAMTPDVPVVSSAYAMVAETLQGKAADEFAQLQGTAAGNLNQANLEYSYSLTNWQRLKDLIDGTSSQYLPTAGTGTFDFGARRITGVTAPGTSANDVVNKGYADAYIGGKGTDLTSVGAGFGGGQTLVWDQAQNKWVTGTAADATKLPLAGGTMSGDILMGGNDLFQVGDILMNTTKRLQLGRYTAAEETALVATLGTGSAGTTWFNTTTGTLMVWNGTAASSTGMSGSAGGDLTGSYPNPSIAAGAVATAKIADNAITAAKIKTTGVAINRLIATDPVTPNNLTYFECGTVDQIIAWTASGWGCTTVASLSPVKTVAGKTPNAAGNVSLSAYDITGIESAATKDYGTAAGELVELDGTGRIPAALLPASMGTITAVTAVSPILGGGVSGNVTVSIDVGTGANQVVRLNGSAQLPAVDGSLLTGVVASNATRIGGYPVSTAAPGSNQILTWNGSAWEGASASASLSWPLTANPGTTPVSAPSYSFNGDSDTGMQSLAANSLTLTTNGAARLTISSSGNSNFAGNVDGYRFRGTGGTAAFPDFAFFNNNASGMYSPANDTVGFVTNSLERMRINPDGLVAIGGTAPAAALDIAVTGTNSALVLPRDTTANRPAGNVLNGMVRYNTNTNSFEGYVNGAWQNFAVGSGVGTVQSVASGTGLLGGPITSVGTLRVDVGAGANQIVQLNGSGQAALNVGSAAAPAYAFGGDTSSGMFGISPGTISFATNGTARMTISGLGRVGIGTTPSLDALTVYSNNLNGTTIATATPGTGANEQALFNLVTKFDGSALGSTANNKGWQVLARGDAYASSNQQNDFGISRWNGVSWRDAVRIDSLTGNFGINNTLPSVALEVYGTGDSSAIMVPRDTTANRPSTNVANGMIRYNTNLNVFEFYQGGGWTTYTTGSGSGGDFYKDGSQAMTGQFRAVNGSAGTPSVSFANSTNTGMYLAGVGTAAFATNGTARMTIDSSGYVGIGTSNPSMPLDVNGDVNAASYYGSISYVTRNLTGTGSAANPSYSFLYGGNAGMFLAGNGSNTIGFSTASTERMRIDASGLVSIGGTAPQAVLDVAGTGTNSAIIVPRNTTANRPAGNVANGMIRYNTNTNKFEFFENNAWVNYGTGSGGGGSGDFKADGSVAMSGAFRAANGSASAPSIAFSSDSDTGWYSPGAGSASLAINGTSRLSVDANSLVFNGTGSESAVVFRANGLDAFTIDQYGQLGLSGQFGVGWNNAYSATSFGQFQESYFVSGQGAADGVARNIYLMPYAAGKVGVGTTAPKGALDVAATGTNSAIVVPRDTTANRPAGNVVNGMIRYNTNMNKFEFFENNAWVNYGTGSGSGGSVSFPLAASPIGSAGAPAYGFSGDTDTGFYSAGAGTASFATNGTARMTITSTGLVGIGTTAPSTELEIKKSVDSAIELTIDNPNTGTNSSTELSLYNHLGYMGGLVTASQTHVTPWYANMVNVVAGGNADGLSLHAERGAGYIRFNAGGAGNERMRILPNGSVGIGTATPASGLDIALTGTTLSSIVIPRDTTANRPSSAVNGMIRYNTNTNKFEFFENNAWVNYGTGSGGGGGSGDFKADGTVQMTGNIRLNNNYISNDGNNEGIRVTNNGEVMFGIPSNNTFVRQPILNIANGTAPYMMMELVGQDTFMFGMDNSKWAVWATEDTLNGFKFKVNGSWGSQQYIDSATTAMTITKNTLVGIGTESPQSILDVYGTGVNSAIIVPRDTTARRPSSLVNGMIRYNTNTNKFEFFENNAWVNYGTGSGGAGGSVSFPLLASPATTPASAVSYSFTGDADTGMHTLAADTLALTTAGTARLTMNASGFVGVGTTSPQYRLDVRTSSSVPQLHISGNNADDGLYLIATGNDTYLNSSASFNGTNWVARAANASLIAQESGSFRFYSNSGLTVGNTFTPTPRMLIGNNGVAIGTAISGGSPTTDLEVASSGGGYPRGILSSQYATNFTGGVFQARKARGSAASPSSVQSGDDLGLFAVSGYDGTDWVQPGQIAFSLESSPSTGNLPTSMAVFTGTGSGGVERVRVTSSGLVGIGTASPKSILDIASTGTTSALVVPRDTTANRPSGNVANGMIRYNTNTNKFEFFENNAWVNLSSGGGGSVSFPLLASPGTTSSNTPSYSFSGDSDTGMWSSWNDILEFSTGGVGRMNITNTALSAAVPITAPYYRASTNGSVGAPAFSFGNDTDTGFYSPGAGTAAFAVNGTARMTIDKTGYVGIGTSAPTQPLHVMGNILTESSLYFTDGGSIEIGGSQKMSFWNSGTIFKTPLEGTSNGNAHMTSGGFPSASDPAYGFTTYAGVGMWAPAANTLRFSTSNTDRLSILANGNVGVGGTAPAAILDVAATGTNSALIVPRDTTANRPSGNAVNGMIRYNTNTNKFEFFENNAWVNYGTGSGGGGGGSVSFPLAASPIGTNAVPAYSFSGDTDTGIYSQGPGTTSIAINGTARFNVTDDSLNVWRNVAAGNYISLDNSSGSSGSFSELNMSAGGKQLQFGVMGPSTNYSLINNGDVYWQSAAATSMLIWSNGAGPIRFASTAAGEIMRISDTTGNVGIGVTNPGSAALNIAGTTASNSAIVIPRATTANRPGTAVNGMLRYNSNTNKFEGYENGSWKDVISASGSFPLLASPATTPLANVSYSFNGDPNTGMHTLAADTLDLATAGTARLTILPTGYVGIGNTAPGEALEVNGNVKATAFVSTSDRRLKTNIRPVEGIEALMKLRGVRYEWKSNGATDIGLIAQEVEEVFPEAVVTDANTGLRAVKYQNLVSPLIESTKEIYGMCKASERQLASIQTEVQQLRDENTKLKGEVEDMKARLERLEKLMLNKAAE